MSPIIINKFKSKDNASQSAKRRHKKNMLESMDTVAYRPIYDIARFTKVRELKLRKLMRSKLLKHTIMLMLRNQNSTKRSLVN